MVHVIENFHFIQRIQLWLNYLCLLEGPCVFSSLFLTQVGSVEHLDYACHVAPIPCSGLMNFAMWGFIENKGRKTKEGRKVTCRRLFVSNTSLLGSRGAA